MHSACRRASTAAGRRTSPVGSAARPRRARHPRCAGVAARHRTVHRRPGAGRRRLTGGGKRGGRGDDPLLRVAVDARGSRSRSRAAAAHRRGRLLPVAVPQRRDTGRGARGRGPGTASRPGRRGHEPWRAISGLGAVRRPGRAGRRGRRCAGPPALAGSTGGARGRTRGRGGNPGSRLAGGRPALGAAPGAGARPRTGMGASGTACGGRPPGSGAAPGIRGHGSSSPRSWPWQATS